MRVLLFGFLLILLFAPGCNTSSEKTTSMEELSESERKLWFEGSNEIECNIEKVKHSFENIGEHYTGIISLMPGMMGVELVEQGTDFVIIKTNEGLMKRTNISVLIHADSVVVEFDEEYQAGKATNTKSHFMDEFTNSGTGVKHRTVISGVEASGFLGFFYRNFGSSNTGNAFLESYKTYLEK